MQADLIAVTIAFLFGFTAYAVGLPPLVGYLVAGFFLSGLGVEATPTLAEFSRIGVTLLLFSLGLKLRLGNLLMPQVWGVTAVHMGTTVLVLAAAIGLFGRLGLDPFESFTLPLTFLFAFAMSFSSTVFAVKVLDDKSEAESFYGRIAIGILIVQDLAAVTFLAFSADRLPYPWALLLLAVIPLRPALNRIMEKAGHGELLILFGLTLALGGAAVFELAGLKGDLGALILGLLLSPYSKASELARHLLGFKDLFLVGFFLLIGLSEPLTGSVLGVAVLLVLLVPLKAALFLGFLAAFRLRARTSFLTSLTLSNYSEFGLIVTAIVVDRGWGEEKLLSVLAVTLAISFILAAPLNRASHRLYARYRLPLRPLESGRLLEEERPIDPGDASVLIFGMGRVGAGAYQSITSRLGNTVVGVDIDDAVVSRNREAGRKVLRGNVIDPDFWTRIELRHEQVKLVLLAMANSTENLFATRQLRNLGYQGKLVAIALYPDEVDLLKQAGADEAFNLHAEAGAGFADHASSLLLTAS